MGNTSKNLTEGEIGVRRKKRRDTGNRHRSPKYGEMVLRCYRMNGEFEREFGSINEAVESFGVGEVSYGGIYNCIHGRQHAHGGFLWRSDKGSGMGLLVVDGKDDVTLEGMI